MGKRWLAFLALGSLLPFVLLTCGTLVPAELGMEHHGDPLVATQKVPAYAVRDCHR